MLLFLTIMIIFYIYQKNLNIATLDIHQLIIIILFTIFIFIFFKNKIYIFKKIKIFIFILLFFAIFCVIYINLDTILNFFKMLYKVHLYLIKFLTKILLRIFG